MKKRLLLAFALVVFAGLMFVAGFLLSNYLSGQANSSANYENLVSSSDFCDKFGNALINPNDFTDYQQIAMLNEYSYKCLKVDTSTKESELDQQETELSLISGELTTISGVTKIECGVLDGNGDGKIDISDFVFFQKQFGKQCLSSSASYTTEGFKGCGSVDANKDGLVNILDFSALKILSGHSCENYREDVCSSIDFDNNGLINILDLSLGLKGPGFPRKCTSYKPLPAGTQATICNKNLDSDKNGYVNNTDWEYMKSVYGRSGSWCKPI